MATSCLCKLMSELYVWHLTAQGDQFSMETYRSRLTDLPNQLESNCKIFHTFIYSLVRGHEISCSIVNGNFWPLLVDVWTMWLCDTSLTESIYFSAMKKATTPCHTHLWKQSSSNHDTYWICVLTYNDNDTKVVAGWMNNQWTVALYCDMCCYVSCMIYSKCLLMSLSVL